MARARADGESPITNPTTTRRPFLATGEMLFISSLFRFPTSEFIGRETCIFFHRLSYYEFTIETYQPENAMEQDCVAGKGSRSD